ncbi:LysR family transcriptional regulator [Sinirhodobacter populi]|uniref:LysR family transcriptional regulator n=1 Tax=Paenirhodobacter populi TaxID=2306993 RepID=A0A443IRC2_9RHOB|nr:LysR family transcriptional regulator [Sinirhodobacter populi]RWR09182.1 LysR family transcriptional regulator [Sinirhodobacter populi]RWR25888.1 LysR family transcriptional regulator [Sinirhodobacter populi]RWR26205.1 LysR family transcriptional regulator [Sinirhodobacter populi]
MQPNWDDLRVFLALAREGSLTGAARRLGAGVATVSRRVERFEGALGVPLFLRHQSGYSLTDQGVALLPRAEAAEEALAGLRHDADAQDLIQGHVRIASIESLITPLLVPALAPLLAAHPGLDVEILFSTQAVNLHRRDADLALRMLRPDHGHLRVRQLVVMGFGLYGPPDGARPIRQISWPDHVSLGTVLAWSRAFAGPDSPHLAVNTLDSQVEAVRLGLGQAVLPHFLARPAGLTLISPNLPDGAGMERPIFMVTHADLAGSCRVSAVAEAIADSITARRAEFGPER